MTHYLWQCHHIERNMPFFELTETKDKPLAYPTFDPNTGYRQPRSAYTDWKYLGFIDGWDSYPTEDELYLVRMAPGAKYEQQISALDVYMQDMYTVEQEIPEK